MAGVNKVILVGRLGQDPDVKYTADGRAIANISIATSDTWKDKNTGEKQERTEWHRVVFFDKLAEIVAEYLKKGSQVYVEGKLQTRKWQDKEGHDRYTTEVVVDGFSGTMQMLDSRGGSSASFNAPSANQGQAGGNHAASSAPAAQSAPAPMVLDDDIPF